MTSVVFTQLIEDSVLGTFDAEFKDSKTLVGVRMPKIDNLTEMQHIQFWTKKELRIIEDLDSFKTLTDNQKLIFYKLILFFIPGDGEICDQIIRLMNLEKNMSVKMFLAAQMDVEGVHAESYTLVFDIFVPIEHRNTVINCMSSPGILDKCKFIEHGFENSKTIGERYVYSAVSEGIFFVSLFAIIFLFKKIGKIPNFCSMNELIRRDEMLHRNFNLEMAKHHGFDPEEAFEIIKTGVEKEIESLKYILSRPFFESFEEDAKNGINVENMTQYIKHLANQMLDILDVKQRFFEVPNDFSLWWITEVSQKNNFFENRNGIYKTTATTEDHDNDSDADF